MASNNSPTPPAPPASQAASAPPAPSVDPTGVASWFSLSNPNLASAAEVVLINNQRVLALQNQNIMQSLEAILITLAKLTENKRGTSTASSISGSSVSSAAHEDIVAENTEVQEAMAALKNQFVGSMMDQYKPFIKDNQKHMYVMRTTRASNDANEFHEHLVTFFKSVDDAHPALEHLNRLNADLKLDLYAFLGRTKKDEDKETTKDTAQGE